VVARAVLGVWAAVETEAVVALAVVAWAVGGWAAPVKERLPGEMEVAA